MSQQPPGQQPPNFWNEMILAPPVLSPQEKALRDKFVTEYLNDYDAYGAAIRIGYFKGLALTYATEFMEDPHVRREITRREQEKATNPEAELQMTQRQVKAWLHREANYRGPGASHSARVQSLNSLAKIVKILDPEGDAAARDEALIKAVK
jgi:hypothetical protein